MSIPPYDLVPDRRSRAVRRRTSALLAVATTLALAASGLAPGRAGAAPAAPPPPAVDTSAASTAAPDWEPCRDGFECATVQVPLDYDRPRGAQIGLSLIRLPAASPRSKIGSLFVNPGGPGGSGVDVVREIGKVLPLELRSRFDIVGFDPRGIARSTPLRCFDTFEEAVQGLPPFAFPYTDEQERQQQAANQKLAAACAEHGGPILKHMSTADVARDLEQLRKAVGDRRLTYVGLSYGSMIGQTYANLFPGRVRSLVIDGVLDPVSWTTGRGNRGTRVPVTTRLRSDRGARATLREFFRLCNQAGPDCALSGGAATRFARLADRVREKPVVVTDPESGEPFPITYDQLIGLTLGGLYSPEIWPDLASLLAALEAEAAPERLARDLATVRAGLATTAQEPYPNFVEGAPAVLCADSTNPGPDAWPPAADRAERAYGYFGRLWTWVSSPCAFWPRDVAEDRYRGPWTDRTANPVLVVGNYYDPATRYRGAVTAARLLPNARLLSYAGWGHTAYFARGNFCINAAVTRYLVTTRLPAKGKVCRPEGSPFGPEPVEASQVKAARTLVSNQGALPIQRGIVR